MLANSVVLVIFIVFAFSEITAKKQATRWHQLAQYSFEKYCDEFGFSYPAGEHRLRKALFERRMIAIRSHNADKTKTWKQGVNKFTAMTEAELRNYYKGTNPYTGAKRYAVEADLPTPSSIPKSVDWRTQGIISNVKDQGQCGSCWTFAAAENVESYYAQKYGYVSVYSEQQILDCTPNPGDCGGTGGCGGGTVELAYQQINMSGGLSTEWTYPYMSYFGGNFTCNTQQRLNPVAQLSGYVNLPSNLNTPVLNHLATTGPLAITIDASAWSFYESGVFNGCNQTNPDLDHGVQLVGYGTDSSAGDYWLVRNSWGAGWGEIGYIRIARTKVPRCGLDVTPLDGDACANNTAPVTVCGTCGILYDCLYPTII